MKLGKNIEMNKILIGLFTLILVPYLFLATSITDGAETSKKGMNCVVSRIEKYKSPIGLISVYYSGFNRLGNNRMVLPIFNINENVFYAQCPNIELMIGSAEGITVGEKIHVYTRINEIRLFGYKLKEELGIYMFVIGWDYE